MKLPNDEILHYKSDDGVTVIVERTELVRCKDCGLCTYIQNIAELSCVHHGGIVLPNDYCSYGERKDGTK